MVLHVVVVVVVQNGFVYVYAKVTNKNNKFCKLIFQNIKHEHVILLYPE